MIGTDTEPTVRVNGVVVGVGSVVDRSNGRVRLADEQFSVLSMEVVSFTPEECPLCKKGVAIDAPGSRASHQQ